MAVFTRAQQLQLAQNPVNNAISADSAISASVAITASYVLSSSYALSSSYTLSSSYALSSSYVLSSSYALSASQARSSSYALSSSYVLSSSYALSSSYTLSSSYALTASLAPNYVLNSATSSFITTGSSGTQTISGSLTIIQNLTVLGSASITNISQSTLNIGTNLITVNTNTPSVRFGGLAVIDSGSSPQRSGSILFDSTNDQWIFIHQNTSGTTTSSIFVQTPQTFNNIGNETNLTTNKVPKSTNAEHIGDSNITDTGTIIQLGSDTQVTGSLNVSTSITASIFSGSSFTGSLQGTASWANNVISASYALTASYALNGGSGGAAFPYTGSAIITGSLIVTGSITSTRGFTGSLLGTASFVSTLRSTGSIGSIQYANNGVLGSSTNLNYNGSNLLLQNGKIYQSDGTTYFTVLGKTGTVGTNETGVWGYDGDLDNIYPITSYDIASNKYYFANYSTVYDGATGFLGIGTSSPTAKLQVVGNVVATSFTGSLQGTASISTQAINARTPSTAVLPTLGSTIKAEPLWGGWQEYPGSSYALVNQRCILQPVYLYEQTILTGVKWVQVTQGAYTGSNYNGIGLYTYSAGTLTCVASSSNNANLWSTFANGTMGSASFSFGSNYNAAAGLYYIAAVWNQTGAITTNPAIGQGLATSTTTFTFDFTNSAKGTSRTTNAVTTALPTSVAMSNITALQNIFYLTLY